MGVGPFSTKGQAKEGNDTNGTKSDIIIEKRVRIYKNIHMATTQYKCIYN